MKTKILISTILLLMFASCTNQNEDLMNICVSKNSENHYLVSESQAINSAITFFKAKGDLSKNIKKGNVKRAIVKSSSVTAQKQEGVYIINFDNNCGYAVVSADTRDSVSIYLASTEGFFDENDNDNQFLLSVINSYQNQTIESQSFNPDKGDYEQTITNVVEAEYGPLLNTKWHQGYPFNTKLVEEYPNYRDSLYIGCVPVAIGQIINYYQYPASVNGENIDWDLISYNWGNNSYQTWATNEISKLLYLIGTDMNINYPFSYGTNFLGAVSEFNRLGYSYRTRNGYDKNIIQAQIALGNPVYMRGDNSINAGHAWVADGYMKVRTMYRAYDDNGNLIENTVLNDYNYDNVYEYIHLNLGWQSNPQHYAITSFEYSSNIDHRIWVYSDIFNFVQGNPEHSYNNQIKMIYDFSINS